MEHENESSDRRSAGPVSDSGGHGEPVRAGYAYALAKSVAVGLAWAFTVCLYIAISVVFGGPDLDS